MGPQADTMRSFASEDDGDAGAPRAASDDGDLAHLFLFTPKRKSRFLAGEQAEDIAGVANDDQQSSHSDQGQDCGILRDVEPPDRAGKESGGQDGSRGNASRQQYDSDEDDGRDQNGER